MKRQWLFFLGITLVGGFLALLPQSSTSTPNYHSEADLAYFKQTMVHPPVLTVDSTQYFPTKSDCEGCHGFDENGTALVDAEGNDVNMTDDWKTSLMANSAKDPFWRAKVTHETLFHPDYAEETETKCTSCHAPMGHYTAMFKGATSYTLQDLHADTVGLDGVSCGACHMMSEEELGLTSSGILNFDTSRVLYGPHEVPFGAPMIQYVGFEPIYSEHMLDAGICAGCHTLVTDTYDLEGQPTGDRFVEQATYHEWLNSKFGVEDISCQSCHMPQLEEPIVISSNYIFLDGRVPYGLHDLVGGNTYMVELMMNFKEELGIDASVEAFEETLQETRRMLQFSTLKTEIEFIEAEQDTAVFELFLTNRSGHKFPSGYPSRIAYIEFLAMTETGDTLFHSGQMDEDYHLVNHDPQFEPHYDVIRDPAQVQIYEQVVGDVAGNFTTVLERGYESLKDNRLTPEGFSKQHYAYDTTMIVGNADVDPNFNVENGIEGSGTDRIRYHISLNDYIGNIEVQAFVRYQSLPPRWIEPMLSESTPEIDTFRNMYYAIERTPVEIDSVGISELFVEGGMNTSVNEIAQGSGIELIPNPASANGVLQVVLSNNERVENVVLVDVKGREWRLEAQGNNQFELPDVRGVFFARIQLADRMEVQPLILQ
ncbi:MAG: hypothetical protein AAGH79_04145 [Bacteroidota bacterium]